MGEFGQWLVLNANRVPATGLLIVGFVAFIWMLYTERIVLGGPYKRCMERVATFEAQTTATAESTAAKAEHLAEAFETFRRDSERQIDKLESENERLRDQQQRPRR